MYVSMKVWDDESGDGGRIEMYRRGSFTCTELIGKFTFDDKQEKKVLLDMLMNGHPDVSIMDNSATTGNFVDNYFKR
ncbi:MAG: hypothetical protein AB9819_01960 [Methanomassiliicoccales archaeon]